MTLDVVKSSEIDGEHLNDEQVRSSIARRLGINTAGLVHSDRMKYNSFLGSWVGIDSTMRPSNPKMYMLRWNNPWTGTSLTMG